MKVNELLNNIFPTDIESSIESPEQIVKITNTKGCNGNKVKIYQYQEQTIDPSDKLPPIFNNDESLNSLS